MTSSAARRTLSSIPPKEAALNAIVLARCWALDDGTACLLSKVGERTWELRVTRGPRLVRAELFSSLPVAVATAAAWRTEYARDAEIA